MRWTTENRARAVEFLAALAELGHVGRACERAQLARGVADRWRLEDAAFGRAWDMALGLDIDVLLHEAMRRGVEGVEEPVFFQGEVVGVKRRYSDKLLSRLLGWRMDEQRREARAVEREAKHEAPQIESFRVVIRDEHGNEIQPEPPDADDEAHWAAMRAQEEAYQAARRARDDAAAIEARERRRERDEGPPER